MQRADTIEQITVDQPSVYAFRIRGEVGADDMKAMSETMNAAFDQHPTVSMLLIFEQYNGVELGAGMDMETMSAQFRSLASVDKYAVVGAPGFAATLINVMDKLIPTDARTFDRSDEQAAWAFVGARPVASPGV